ncbi:energy-coupling factor transporter transmembrane component T family protein [Microbacterium marinilacus]|uniref:Energy-coupling factor transporter transmembrane protein EcfT n=1 Tax=Microbacterium marinilacus TaxID=415209 RepID=A0ABP7BH77_9MICO|nr:energy-coupling factor transporter transmembrane component T [Microbacterium marinilacus]MBY0690352.1 energy-coupling factor transporter transmembrane protein EcfT [Microbacterium marinilacus]
MISLYRPGDSPLHRAPAGAKLAGLAVLALAISLVARTVPTAAAALVLVCLAFAFGGFGPATWLRQLWAARWIVVLVAATQLVFLTPAEAFANTTRVVSVVMLAGLLTLTTRTSALLEALQRALMPLRHVGVDPWRVGFTLTLTIALVPVVGDFATRIREAQRARGVRLGARSVVTLLVMSLRHADDVADALGARGIG